MSLWFKTRDNINLRRGKSLWFKTRDNVNFRRGKSVWFKTRVNVNLRRGKSLWFKTRDNITAQCWCGGRSGGNTRTLSKDESTFPDTLHSSDSPASITATGKVDNFLFFVYHRFPVSPLLGGTKSGGCLEKIAHVLCCRVKIESAVSS